MRLVHAAAAAALATVGLVAAATPARAASQIASNAPASMGLDAFRLPWAAGASEYLTQDAGDDCCGDHLGANRWAFDFALPTGGAFDVVAPRDGTIVHVKMSSNHGCGDLSCVNEANYVVIDHGDGTQTTMLHLAKGSLDPSLSCGSFVRRGERIGTTGATGWATGVHLHVERDAVRAGLKKTCECGADGMGCAADAVEWNLFWPTGTQPNLPVSFDEWPDADKPNDRRGLIGPSRNDDDGGRVAIVGSTAVKTGPGAWKDEAMGAYAATYKLGKVPTDASSEPPSATISLKSASIEPGDYAVWAYVPLDVPASLGAMKLTIEGVSGVIDESTTGGAFHPVRGLERVHLTGATNESIVATSLGKDVAVDAILLRRLPDPRIAKEESPMKPKQIGLSIASSAKGGGASIDEPAEHAKDAPANEGRSTGAFFMLGAIALGGVWHRVAKKSRA